MSFLLKCGPKYFLKPKQSIPPIPGGFGTEAERHRLMIESRSHADVSFHISTHLPKQSTQKKLALYKQHLTLPCSWFSFYNCLIVRLQRPAPPDCVIYITCSLLKEALRFDEALHIPALRAIVIIQLFHLFRTNLTGAAESKWI